MKRWSGDVIQRKDGYRLIWAPGHPNANSGRVYEHRLVAEALVGRPLRSDEIVHHINEDRSDNRLENLRIVTKREHQIHHLGCGISDAEVAEMVRSGMGAGAINRLGVSTHRVSRIRKELGVARVAA